MSSILMEYHLIVRTRLDKWRTPSWTIARTHLSNRITKVSQEHRLWTETLPVCRDGPLLAEPGQGSDLNQDTGPCWQLYTGTRREDVQTLVHMRRVSIR